MNEMSRPRPIFHSEADFQYALAWFIHTTGPDCGPRLEFKPFPDEGMYLDLWFSGIGIALELKYVTRGLEHKEGGEFFSLRNQSAQDTRRYDFLRDVQRLERVSSRKDVRGGYAIMLTNDASYWEVPAGGRRETNDSQFRLHEGRKIGGLLDWSTQASPGTKKGRETPIELNRSYELNWRDYSTVPQKRNNRFRFLSVYVPR